MCRIDSDADARDFGLYWMAMERSIIRGILVTQALATQVVTYSQIGS